MLAICCYYFLQLGPPPRPPPPRLREQHATFCCLSIRRLKPHCKVLVTSLTARADVPGRTELTLAHGGQSVQWAPLAAPVRPRGPWPQAQGRAPGPEFWARGQTQNTSL